MSLFTASDISKLVQDLEDDIEGYVIRFDTGHMVKMKLSKYVRIHRAKDSILQEKRTIEMILNEKVDDVLPHLIEHDKKALEGFQMDFWKGVLYHATRLAHLYELAFCGHDGDKRAFAIASEGKLEHHDRSIIFSVWGKASRRDDDGVDILWQVAKEDILTELKKRISTKLGSQSSVDGARWIWGGVRWADYIGAAENESNLEDA